MLRRNMKQFTSLFQINRVTQRHVCSTLRSSRRFIATTCSVHNVQLHNKGQANESTSSSVPTERQESSIQQMRKPLTNSPFVKNLFIGQFDKSMLEFPEVLSVPELEELNAMLKPVERFFKEEVDSAAIDRDANIPTELLDTLKSLGLFGQQVPIEFGGLGFNATKFTRMAEVIALDASIATTLSGHLGIGYKGLLLAGTEEQKARYLPRLATGELLAAFCLTEPSSGSDAASITSKATVSEDGQTYYINGSKIWITNGGIADVFTVFAKTEVKDEQGNTKEKITAFFVEREFGGVTSGPPEDKMGIRGKNTCEVHFDNTPVPKENIIGEVGGGFKVAMNILNSGRFNFGSFVAGILKNTMGSVAEHAISRTQFKTKLKDFELIKHKFADMAVNIYAMESMSYMTAATLDSYQQPDASIEAAIVKVFSSEAGWRLGNEALQVMGGMGYMKAYPYERHVRDARILLIFEGTNEVLRLYIGLACLQFAGNHYRETVKKLKDPMNNVGLLFKTMFERGDGLAEKPKLKMELNLEIHPMLGKCAEELETRVYHLKYMAQQYLTDFRDSLEQEQVAVARFADIAIDLYAVTCVLARCSRSVAIGQRGSDHEVNLAEAFSHQAMGRIDRNIQDLRKGRHVNNDERMVKIADDIFKAKGYVAEHPLSRTWD